MKWPEMPSKVNFGHPKWQIDQKLRVAYRFEMARNAIEREFRTSKMADVSHFVKNSKQIRVAYRSEMARNAIKSDFRTSKIGADGHFVNKNKSFELI